MDIQKLLNNITSFFRYNPLKNIFQFLLLPSFIWYLIVGFFSLSLARVSSAITVYAVNNVDSLGKESSELSKKNSYLFTKTEEEITYDPSVIVEEGGKLFTIPEGEEKETLEKTATSIEETVPFLLLGTLEGHYTYARALIQVFGRNTSTKEYSIGNRIKAARLRWIGREYIIYTENGKRKKLKTGERSDVKDKEKEKNQKKKSLKSKSNNLKKNTHKVLKKVLSREEILRITKANTAEIYKNAQFGPWFQNGKIGGYKISKISTKHIFYRLGARSGDIIKKVNGHSLDDMKRLIDIYQGLDSANNIKVEILRRGKNFTYDFTIQD